jgi:sec-independent protein translocase protein TatB
MFDIGWSELLLIGIVALIVIGPKELPGALRTLGQWMGKVRRMAGEFQSQFHEAMREAEVADLKKEVDEMTAKASNFTNFDPIGDVQKDIEKSIGDLPSLDAPPPSASPTDVPTPDIHQAVDAPPSEPAAAPADSPVGANAVGAPSAAEPAAPAPPPEQPPAQTDPDAAATAKPDPGRAPA